MHILRYWYRYTKATLEDWVANLPSNRHREWDKFRESHAKDTVRDIINVRWSSEAYRVAWLKANGLTGDELAEQFFGATETKCPDWFGV